MDYLCVVTCGYLLAGYAFLSSLLAMLVIFVGRQKCISVDRVGMVFGWGGMEIRVFLDYTDYGPEMCMHVFARLKPTNFWFRGFARLFSRSGLWVGCYPELTLND